MILKAGKWYTRKGMLGDTHIYSAPFDVESNVLSDVAPHVQYIEISPPTITPIAKDLSQAKVGDTVEWFHSSALIMRFFEVLFVDEDTVILLEVDSRGKPTPGMRVRTVCNKADYPSYTLLP